jgi:hypothetical protein
VRHRTHFCAKPYTLIRLTATGGAGGGSNVHRQFSQQAHSFQNLHALKMLKFATVVGKAIVALSVELREMAIV